MIKRERLLPKRQSSGEQICWSSAERSPVPTILVPRPRILRNVSQLRVSDAGNADASGPPSTMTEAQAFAWADQVRTRRERLVDAVRAGEFDLSRAFAEAAADPFVGRAFAVKVFEVLPGVGKVKARRTMASMGFDEDVRLDAIEDKDQEAFVDVFAQG